jgi:hypothetical protein
VQLPGRRTGLVAHKEIVKRPKGSVIAADHQLSVGVGRFTDKSIRFNLNGAAVEDFESAASFAPDNQDPV